MVDPAPTVQAAHDAHLHYMSDERPGLSRRRHGRGFAYFDAAGAPVRDPALRTWLRELAIPPAWQEVWISPRRDGHLLATGRDEKGRKQYLYHPRWTELRAETNFHRLAEFGRGLPALRVALDADMRRRGLSRERVLALVVHLLDSTLIRVGSPRYAKENRSFGLTTLRTRHLELSGTTLRFEFRGKSGKRHRLALRDPRAARIVRACQELPGQELFQYLDDEGQRRSVDSADVNEYLARVAGDGVTAKQFRTWGGSVAMVAALRELPEPATAKALRQNLRLALRASAERLGNTQAVCRRHYVHPVIARLYEEGRFFALCRDAGDGEDALSEDERALLALLEAEA